MRLLPLLLSLILSAATLSAEMDFVTGMGARLVIGQETFTSQEEGASATVVGAVGGLAYANDTLFVADSSRVGSTPINHRVLLYNNLSQMLPGPTDELPQDSRCPVCVGEASVVLGQLDFEGNDWDLPAADGLRRPTAVATDGVRLAVADTDNNRVLIWNSIPTYNAQPADVVVGQPDFSTSAPNAPTSPTSQSLRGPQGVWLQDGRLFVADTGNNRVLMWDPIPTSNHAPANVVVGRDSFIDYVPPDLIEADFDPQADSLLTPVSVTSDGQRLYVSDLGHNRVLIWNSIPAQNSRPADVVLGQPDMTSGIPNYFQELCDSTGLDSNGNELFPPRCAATLSFPRFALSDGQRLFIADGGNDRVLVYNQVPVENGAPADHVVGQPSDTANMVSDADFPNEIASAGVLRTPLSLAWDGLNLFVSDPFNRRVSVFTIAEKLLDSTGVRNAGSIDIFANSIVLFSGSPTDGEDVTLIVQNDRDYTYRMRKDDTLGDVINGLAGVVNEGNGDPDLVAVPNSDFFAMILTARKGGPEGNLVEYGFDVSRGATTLGIEVQGTTLQDGGEATRIAPGTIVTILGENLAAEEAVVPEDPVEGLPREYGGVQVYFDGVLAPLFYISPDQINAQMPVEFSEREGTNAYVRTVHADGSVVATNVIPVPIISANPGVFAFAGGEPRQAVAVHSSSYAHGVVSVDGIAREDDVATIIIGPEDNQRRYTYTVKASDVPEADDNGNVDQDFGREKIQSALIDLVNNDPEVEAFPSGQFQRIILRAREPGPEYDGIPYSVETNSDTFVVLTATTDALCCANEAGALVTEANPALPGEVVTIYATGLGLVEPDAARDAQQTGKPYNGPEQNKALRTAGFVGGRGANILFNGLQPGAIGLFRIDMQLNQALLTNPFTVGTIAQGFQVSNLFTIAIVAPDDGQ